MNTLRLGYAWGLRCPHGKALLVFAPRLGLITTFDEFQRETRSRGGRNLLMGVVAKL